MPPSSVPIIYLFIYGKIRKRANSAVVISCGNVLEVLKRTFYQVPRMFHYEILKDMEKYKLLKKIDRKKYGIIGGNADSTLNRFNFPF